MERKVRYAIVLLILMMAFASCRKQEPEPVPAVLPAEEWEDTVIVKY